MTIARLIADPEILGTMLDPWASELAGQGMRLAGGREMEGPGDAVELVVEGGDKARVLEAIERRFGPCDVLVADAPFEAAAPGLFVSDMDSTMIGQECIDELADYAGLKPKIAAITDRAMRGELDFEAALRERVRLLAGLEENAIEQCLAERIAPVKGACTLVQTLHSLGWRTVLVTGGFHHFADSVASKIGFESTVANRLEVHAGKLTGRLAGPVCDSATKREVLVRERSAIGAGGLAVAAGDGANDAPMLKLADHGFAVRAKPPAREAANARIDRSDLVAVLRLLGIARKHWVDAG